MNHYHFTVIGYTKLTEDGKSYKGSCDVTFIGFINEKEAIERTKAVIDRPNYILARVWECNTCPYQEAIKRAVQEQEKFFKKENNEDY